MPEGHESALAEPIAATGSAVEGDRTSQGTQRFSAERVPHRQRPRPGAGVDVVWLWTDGTPMSPAFAMWLNGAAITDTDGNMLTDDTLLIGVQRLPEPTGLHLPASSLGEARVTVLDTTRLTGPPPEALLRTARTPASVGAPSLLVLLRKD